MISNKIIENMKNGSAIRAMFEEGARLSKIYGADKVFDFSIGNPDVEPPTAVTEALKKFVLSDEPKLHAYMNNAGYPEVRGSVAAHLKNETGAPLEAGHIVMTCGAGGALNVIFKTLLNPGEEVIILSPYFVEYMSYIDNHGGKGIEVPTSKEDFQPDPEAIYNAITPKTKAIIINSPNNPTGVIYSRDVLVKIAEKLEAREKEFDTTIYVISDEPYRKIIYDGAVVTPVFSVFKNALMADSFSKSLSLPGERIGYIAANPLIQDVEQLVNGLIYCNRTLGFVNAPGLFQRILPESLDAAVDVDAYRVRRDMLYDNLISFGYKCIKPQGAFYLFPESLIPDDAEFCKRAVKYNLLLVPGRSFSRSGHFRIAYCVSKKTIENSLPAFEALAKEFR